jgi:hypothetical protein
MIFLAIPGEASLTSLNPGLAIRWLGVRKEKGTYKIGSFCFGFS